MSGPRWRRGPSSGDDGAVDPGPVVLVVLMLLVLPSVLFLGGAVIAVVLGWSLKEQGEATHEGSELIELNK